MSDGAALRILEIFRTRGQSLAICETSAGGLLQAALIAVPGASAYCLGGAVAYSQASRGALLGVPVEAAKENGVVSELFALILAKSVRERVGADWGLAESGIAGPQIDRRSRKPAGLVSLAVVGPGVERSRTLQLADSGRDANMRAFAGAAIDLLLEALA